MAEVDSVTLATINYYIREKQWRHAQSAAQEGLRKYNNDSVLRFFNGFTMVLEDRVQDGMRELESLLGKRDVNLCTYIALMYAHKICRSVDKEALIQLDEKLKSERKQAGERGLFYAGTVLYHLGKPDKAREYIDRMLKQNAESKDGLALRGWIELEAGRDSKKAVKYFDEALGQAGQKEVDALFGKAKFFEQRKNYSGAIELINQIVVSVPKMVAALVEKMKLQLSLQDWDLAIDVAQRALVIDSGCLEANRFIILQILCREGNYEEAGNLIGELLGHMERTEPKNAYLFNEYSKTFSRLSGRSPHILQQTYALQEKAVSIQNTKSEYLNELGLQMFMQGRVKDSLKCYRNAMKYDENSVAALTGVIRCQLQEDQLNDASQQLEFLNEIQQNIGKSPELCFLTAILARKKGKSPETVIDLLSEAVELHFANLRGLVLGTDYFYNFNPDFLIEIVEEYMNYAPQQPPTAKGQPIDPVLKKCSFILDPLTKNIPGSMEALFLMAKVKYLTGNIDIAQGTLKKCLDIDSTFSDGHVLMAQIYSHQGNFKLANQSLDYGLSYNFEVREHPLYHLIKARIFKKQEDYEQARNTLQAAMQLPGVKSNSQQTNKKKISISTNDRVSVFLELAEAHRHLDEQHEAAKVMQDALNEFQGTPEEIRITVANSDLALARGDVEGALAMLRNVAPDQAYFVQAREKMAEIYLNYRKDKRLYASCYRELVDKHPSPETCLLLGDAYMAIQEPEKAIEVYESALKKNPRDYGLAQKIGQALVKTHNYNKAINYYEAALKAGGQARLRFDLAELLVRIRQYDKAEKVLNQALEAENNATEFDSLISQSKYYILLSQLYAKRVNSLENQNQCIAYLQKAKDVQNRVLRRVTMEQPDSLAEQKNLAAKICKQMAENAYNERDFTKAIQIYKEALTHAENDGKLMLELAKLYLTTDNLDECQHLCMSLLKKDEETDAATIMMADVMFRKKDYEQATYHFKQLLSNRPDNFEALERLVDLMRRAGQLEDVPKFLEMAEKASSRANIEAGFNYCKGLYYWYAGDPTTALNLFNKARKDSEWGLKSMYNMIEICLNPDNETLGGEVFEAVDADPSERQDTEQFAAMKTAEKFIKELKPKQNDLKPVILHCMWLIATKKRQNVDEAVNTLSELVMEEQQSKENVEALHGMAVAFVGMKQQQKARNFLKRIAKAPWNMEDAEALERSWLLLADMHIQTGKHDLAVELLKKVIQYNASCAKAYEYLGHVMEKEQSYEDAANNYEQAWKYSHENNPNIGFKLAFNYLKSKRYVGAIDVCQKVIDKNPNYPRIKKEILEKARQNIRT
ncbi:DgyrCDS5817 [Dimorphilus gyrociliatus]|uniref:DgyrCDS5817 n=1 Tax=Dimorphilus gyrociliatus TaxID=2664684 RepID=A0A7I8VL21_9ANNE|nr:DgyrCDS5817 [Dimorphilus gyrociliatus]